MLAMMTPTAMKISHTLESHKHEVCKSKSLDHFHEYEYDCEFSKFNLSPQYFVDFEQESLAIRNQTFKKYYSYNSVHTSEPFRYFSQRGPPSLV